MASKLKVEDLRTELAQRGLTTTGPKPTLVRRLESALRAENKKSADTANDSVPSKKRGREDGDGDSNGPEKINAVDGFRDMGVQQLRKEAALRGVSTTGSKKELIEKLHANSQDSKAATEAKEEDGAAEIKDENGDSNGSEKIDVADKFKDMGVQQLRKEAAHRGLSTSGSKKELIEKLCSFYEDSKSVVEVKGEANDAEMKENQDSNACDNSNAVDKFQEMGIQQLRKEAVQRGLSAKGSKKELIERLSGSSQDSKAVTEATEESAAPEIKTEKIVTATKKGAAVLDQWLADDIKTHFHVLQMGDEIYDAMLNQTNVGDNNNKFYVIQVLESDDGGRFMVYNRWGRVGVKGQDKLIGPYTSRDSAVQEFEQKFLAKTKNYWSNRRDFICHPKCYAWLEMDYADKENEAAGPGKSHPTEAVQLRETKLESRIAKFISLICNVSMMKQQMMEIGYNAEKLPLGKLSKSTILKGYGVLKRISDVINGSNRKMLEQLSGEFYTTIPHDFGFKKMHEFVIDTPQKLKNKLEMVEALGEIELATKLLKDDIENQDDPIFSNYQRLRCELTPLEVDSEEFSVIKTYMKNTHARTHSNYTVDIVQLFRVSRDGEAERFRKFSDTKNRMLLWHGSRLTNWTGILSQGLRIAPPEAPVTGYMFGKGVYFADMFSKSANYCYSNNTVTSGVLLLCEVALGDMEELATAKYDADKLPDGKLSTKGVGATAPDYSEAKQLKDGIVVPLGKPKTQKGPKGHLLYNEYIVYNVDQIRMRYLVHVNFNFKR